MDRLTRTIGALGLPIAIFAAGCGIERNPVGPADLAFGDTPAPGTDSASACTDGTKDGEETDIDCGGACSPCERGGRCRAAADCRSGSCVQGVCAAPAPRLTSVSPRIGPSTGGGPLTLRGEAFVAGPGLSVQIDGVVAAGVSWLSDREIVATLPARPGKAGAVAVTVINPDGQTASDDRLFSYYLGALAFDRPASFAAGIEPYAVQEGDVDRDGVLDLFVTDDSAMAVHVLRGHGDGTFATPESTSCGGVGPHYLVVGDLDGNGSSDAALSNLFSDSLAILLGSSRGRLDPPRLIPAMNHNPSGLVVADFDRDTHPDIAQVVTSAGAVRVLLGTGDGTFTPAGLLPWSGLSIEDIEAADLDGDGAVDLAVPEARCACVQLFFGRGDGSFVPGGTLAASSHARWVRARDFDGDRIPDLAVVDEDRGVFLFPGDGKRGFGNRGLFGVAGPFTSVAAADLNLDGRFDLLLTGQFGGVNVLLGDGVNPFRLATVLALPSAWAVAAGDLDRDGLPDLAVSNRKTVWVFLNRSR